MNIRLSHWKMLFKARKQFQLQIIRASDKSFQLCQSEFACIEYGTPDQVICWFRARKAIHIIQFYSNWIRWFLFSRWSQQTAVETDGSFYLFVYFRFFLFFFPFGIYTKIHGFETRNEKHFILFLIFSLIRSHLSVAIAERAKCALVSLLKATNLTV